MSLSRHERSLLNEIGRHLLEDDPQLATRLGKPPRPASSSWILAGGVLLTLAGFLVLMTGAVLMSTGLGAAGFIAMTAGALLASQHMHFPGLRWANQPPIPEVRHDTSVE